MPVVWQGEIVFEKSRIKVSLRKFATEQEPKFISVCSLCNEPINEVKKCLKCQTELAPSQIKKAFKISKTEYIQIDPQEIKKLQSQYPKEIYVEYFFSKDDFNYSLINKSYYLIMDESTTREYVFFLRALEETKTIAVAKFFFKKEYPAIIRAQNDMLYLHTLFYPQDIKKIEIQDKIPQRLTHEEFFYLKEKIIQKQKTEFISPVEKDLYSQNIFNMIREKILSASMRKILYDEKI